MDVVFSNHFPLRNARTHEAGGPGALAFAFSLAGQLAGKVMWISEHGQAELINPAGFSPYLDPQNLLLTRVKDQANGLAVAEESLRSTAVALVVVEMSKPIGLTEGRRLQLAAEAGQSTGLCLLPEGMGSNAAETRWHCAPIFNLADIARQRWTLTKNKSGALSAWDVKWDAEARRVVVLSETPPNKV